MSARTVSEALAILNAARAVPGRVARYALVCGSTPLHLGTFVAAELQRRLPEDRVELATGPYGDLLGGLERCGGAAAEGAAVVLEWADLDRRLGLRDGAGWRPGDLPDMVTQAAWARDAILAGVGRLAARMPVAVSVPTLPLPPASFTPGWVASELATDLRHLVAELAAGLVRTPGVRLVDAQRLDGLSPLGTRLDVRSYLMTGFPYRRAHAAALAELLVRLLVPPAPKKALITDLDDTLWRGVLGESTGVSWDLDHKSHAHALYQQLLAGLAEAGVLIGVVCKADRETVEAGLAAEGLFVPRERLFPVEAHWAPKSVSVERILRAWNLGADGVVFVDDSAAELAEVAAVHPDVTGVRFPTGDDGGVYAVLEELRDLFGKPVLSAEDALRARTVGGAPPDLPPLTSGAERQDAFLSRAEQELVVLPVAVVGDPRPLELVNKTNQFNLNGRRYTEGEWRALLGREGAFAVLLAYRDRYGPLGKVSVVAGRLAGRCLRVDTWVLSCRAFSRRIEWATLDFLFDRLKIGDLAFAYAPTPKNHLVADFLRSLADEEPGTEARVTAERFAARKPPLFVRCHTGESA